VRTKKRKAVLFFVGIVFAVGCGMLVHQLLHYRLGQADYDEAVQLVELPDLSRVETVPLAELPPVRETLPEAPFQAGEPQTTEDPAEPEPEPVVWVDPYADALKAMDFAALRQANEDVLGWIVIPNTNLSYPLLQGEDNDYYLDHTWRKGRNSVGAIFMDYRSSWNLGDFHTVIYGHRMNNRSMFGQLHNYKDTVYWQSHPNVYIADDNGSHTYKIFSVYEAGSGKTYQMEFTDDSQKQNFIDYCLSKSVVNTGVVPTVNDRIITLSTCTGNGHDTRWVVQAALTEAVPENNEAEP